MYNREANSSPPYRRRGLLGCYDKRGFIFPLFYYVYIVAYEYKNDIM